ncbi:hypothetical protein PCC6912_39690 [Chlorogloeopsis fritschii PCC 6912]|uniref:Uncharacterized protein n=1 Tax=Chlorogloeopsis fritschii PCC 6912 TaxID=211165 RepID=A0A3S1AE42_CHLFR|nr:hypothetical protein [Chlorogloeopsis fritschii]RUR77010.1 hypothetical protein PCC6912_39690 [Chlorogloeopsis fritschii PCC 6912]
MNKVFSVIALIVFGICFLLGVDSSQLTHHSYNAHILDKWHEEVCSPIYDYKGNYLGEDCGDDYTLVLRVEDQREELRVSGDKFKSLKLGDQVLYEYDTGRLGLKHNTKIF